MTVSRETVQALSQRHNLPAPAAERLLAATTQYDLPDPTVGQLATLLAALDAEPSPPTTVTDPTEAANTHIADSLSGLQARSIRTAARIADIGAGAGFPGLVLAAALPTATVDLIESTTRKCEVISRLADAAGITNARAIPVRAEEWAAVDGGQGYDVVTARALASLAVLLEYAAPLLTIGGSLVAWKGARDSDEERIGAKAAEVLGMKQSACIPVRPFEGSNQRHIYIFEKINPTPDRFPRRAGMATKRPIAS